MATQAEWQTRKSEAEAALHRLMTSQAAEEIVTVEGRRVRYTAVNFAGLQSYINFCEQKIEESARGFRRPIFFVGGR